MKLFPLPWNQKQQIQEPLNQIQGWVNVTEWLLKTQHKLRRCMLGSEGTWKAWVRRAPERKNTHTWFRFNTWLISFVQFMSYLHFFNFNYNLKNTHKRLTLPDKEMLSALHYILQESTSCVLFKMIWYHDVCRLGNLGCSQPTCVVTRSLLAICC